MRRKIISFFLLTYIIFNLAACSSVAINENNTAKNGMINAKQKQEKDCEVNRLGFITFTVGLAITGGMIGYRIWPHEDMTMILTTLGGTFVGFYSGWFLSYLFNFTCEPYPKSTQNSKE